MSGDKRKTTVTQSLFPKLHGPGPSGTRAKLDEGLGTPSQPFTLALSHVNRSLASHENTDLSPEQAEKYIKRAKKVESMKLSNTGAHVDSAVDWFKQSNWTGVFMNLGGAFFSGVRDHANYKTGKVFRGKK